MKKYFLPIFITFITILSCEKDDICIEETTPKLIITFYDNENQSEKKGVTSLTVWAEGKDSIYEEQTLDSIAIPLDVNENTTLYKFSSEDIIDEINFSYERKDIFVSRSCGYKTIFKNLDTVSSTKNWIKSIDIKQTIIENDTAAHITIFH